jgi:hypothetical protein
MRATSLMLGFRSVALADLPAKKLPLALSLFETFRP